MIYVAKLYAKPGSDSNESWLLNYPAHVLGPKPENLCKPSRFRAFSFAWLVTRK